MMQTVYVDHNHIITTMCCVTFHYVWNHSHDVVCVRDTIFGIITMVKCVER